MVSIFDQSLTRREQEIIRLIAKGLDSRQIAVELRITYFTVRKHRSNILPKLKLHDAAELQVFAVKHFTDENSEIPNPRVPGTLSLTGKR